MDHLSTRCLLGDNRHYDVLFAEYSDMGDEQFIALAWHYTGGRCRPPVAEG